MKTVNALRDCNLLVFCGYPRDMADMPMQRRGVCPNERKKGSEDWGTNIYWYPRVFCWKMLLYRLSEERYR